MTNWVQLNGGGGYDFDLGRIFGRYSMERDLAYPLAGLNRFSGHTKVRWSVAIHSVVVARLVEAMTDDRNVAAAGLLHDAHESLTGDITTPVAKAVGSHAVERMKGAAQLEIERVLKLDPNRSLFAPGTKHVVGLADSAAMFIEKQLLMSPEPRPWGVPPPPTVYLQSCHDIVLEILKNKEHEDGGFDEFCFEYRRLVE